VLTRLRNRLGAALLERRAREPYVRSTPDGPLLLLPGVLDPVATRVGAWLAAAAAAEARPGERWLDMGCGSGVVALALAGRGVRVTAADVDPRCVRTTRANAALRELPVEVVESDLFAAAPGPWDGVVYNVPFWPGEPRGTFGLAFYAGDDLRAVRRYVEEGPRHARRVLVALSEAGPRHAEVRELLGPHRCLKRERVGSEWLGLYELEAHP